MNWQVKIIKYEHFDKIKYSFDCKTREKFTRFLDKNKIKLFSKKSVFMFRNMKWRGHHKNSTGPIRIVESLIFDEINKNIQTAYCNFLVQAGKRKIPVTINLKEFIKLRLNNKCHYCKITFEFNKRLVQLDRMDSKKGYDVKNVVSCCGTCNLAKRRMDYERFKTLAKYLKKYNRRLKNESN